MPQLEHQLPISHELIKMKSIILVALALVAVAAASPVDNPPAAIVRSEFNQNPQGSYNFGFETSDGTNREETGVVKEAFDEDNKPHNVVVVRGSYRYINPEGQEEVIRYIADEEGFHPEGPSIPVAPVARR
ncbi:larval cuticle protein 1-like isoform X1 [Trichoplusia ni]|uniref:Larval cuticle protein 1-like isoform X1 n=1 Tax=Trichoplusia ni TaxID=7111 RepID=A0A7E5VM48_TRINI|nr:larval cuticle protein 1-like isoform X1 [Trichoplusia ni]